MNKRELFIKAMQAECYKRLAWSFSAFCMTRENEDEYKKDPYSYRIICTPTGYFYCDPDKNGELVKVDDGIAGQPLFGVKERLNISPADIPNLDKEIESSYGNLITNWITLVNSFGKKVPYQEGKFSLKKIEEFIIKDIQDVPEEGVARDESKIYIDEYVKFADSVFFLTGFSQICVWTVTPKLLMAPPGIKEFKAKLLAENAGHLNDAATIARIDSQLVKYDSEWLKGDPGENFLISDKSRELVRKKLYLMHGAEQGIDDTGVNVTLIKNSLSEGWDINAFPLMIDSLRIGAYKKGAETALGGEAVKWMLRASSNMNITEDDCGSRLGKIITVSKENLKDIIGFSIIMKEGSKEVNTMEEAMEYVGRKIMVRSPMYCKLTRTDYCKTCVGKKLALNVNGLSSAVSMYGSIFMLLCMKANHGKSLKLAKMNYLTAIV